MDVYKRESLWPLEPYNDQEVRVAGAISSTSSDGYIVHESLL